MNGDTALMLSLISVVVLLIAFAFSVGSELSNIKKKQTEDLHLVFNTLSERLDNHFQMHEKTMSVFKEYDTILQTQDKKINTVTKQLNAVSEALGGKQEKTTFSLDEYMNKLPKTKKKPVKKSNKKVK